MRRKMLLALLVFALVSGSVTGCGDQSKDDSQTTAEELGEQTEESGSEGEINQGTVNLKFWCDEEETELFQELTNTFIAEHKNEVNLEVEYEPIGASGCKDAFLEDVTNGADIFCIPDDQVLTMVASGVLEEVTNGDAIAAQHVEGAVDAASVNGTLYAYPVSADNGYFLYYDKKYFTEEDVKTMDRILEVCEANHKKFIMDWTSGWYLYSFFGNTGLTLRMNEDGLTNSCDWNATEGAITGVDVAKGMLAIAKSPGFLNGSEFAQNALDGTAIAAVSGVWDIASIKEAYGDDYGACKLPTYTCAGKQVQMASFTGYRLFGVNSYSENKAWAEKLAEYLTSEESQTIRFEQAQRGPSNIHAAASDAVQQVPAIAAVLEQSEFGVLQKVGQKYWTPVTNFGTTIAEGNPNNVPLQDLLDQMVAGITE